MRILQRIWLVLLAAAIAANGQTQVDLRTQARNVDFSSASSTKPTRTGNTLPAACQIGELFFKLNAAAGQNLYACTSLNVWTVIVGSGNNNGGGGGGSAPTSAGALLDFQVTRNSGTLLSIGTNCTGVTPCNVRFGNRIESFTSGAQATISGTQSGLAFFYVSTQGVLTVGYDTITVACNAGCTAISGITSFPPDSVPLAIWSASGGLWDAEGWLDFRGFLSTKSIAASTGLIGMDVAGLTTISIDTTMVGLRVGVPSTATSNCLQGSWAANASFHYICVAPNTWRRSAVSTW
jgi:hypothetical protein